MCVIGYFKLEAITVRRDPVQATTEVRVCEGVVAHSTLRLEMGTIDY